MNRHPYLVSRARLPNYQISDTDNWGIAWTPGEPHPGYAKFDENDCLIEFVLSEDQKLNQKNNNGDEMTALKVAEWALEQDELAEYQIISKTELEELENKPQFEGDHQEVYVLTMSWVYGDEEEYFESLDQAKARREQWILRFGDVFSDWKVTKQVRISQEVIDLS